MKYFLVAVETLGQVLVLTVPADNESHAIDLVADVLDSCTGRYIAFEITKESYDRRTYHGEPHGLVRKNLNRVALHASGRLNDQGIFTERRLEEKRKRALQELAKLDW